jgi:membrane protease YdiL (CAAX protease family)
MIETLKRYFGFTASGGPAPRPLPVLQVAMYSIGIIAVFFIGTVLESRLRSTGYSEAFGAIPVLVFAILVARLPAHAPISIKWGWRALLLSLPFLFLLLADFSSPAFSADQTAAVWRVVIVQVLGIAIGEELTFRFGLHRLWSHYGAWFYVVASSLIFAVMHYPLGLQVSVLSGLIGAAFAASRAAGMPLIPLIVLHAFLDIPAVFRAVTLN